MPFLFKKKKNREGAFFSPNRKKRPFFRGEENVQGFCCGSGVKDEDGPESVLSSWFLTI